MLTLESVKPVLNSEKIYKILPINNNTREYVGKHPLRPLVYPVDDNI